MKERNITPEERIKQAAIDRAKKENEAIDRAAFAMGVSGDERSYEERRLIASVSGKYRDYE